MRNPPSIYVRTSWSIISCRTTYTWYSVTYKDETCAWTGFVVWMMTIFRKFYPRSMPVCCFPSRHRPPPNPLPPHGIIQPNEWHPSHDGTELFLARGCRNPLGKPFSYTFAHQQQQRPQPLRRILPAPFWTEWPSGAQSVEQRWMKFQSQLGNVLLG